MTPDEHAISDIVGQLEAAWNGSNGQAYAACFTDDAVFIHIFGGQLDGRSAIEAAHQHIFETLYKNSRARFLLRSIRRVRPDVAIVLVEQHVSSGEGNETRELHTRPTLIVVREQGTWRIAALQNTRISEVPVAAQSATRFVS